MIKKIIEYIKKNHNKIITTLIGVLGLLVSKGNLEIDANFVMLIEFSSYFLIYFGFDEEAYKLLDTIKKK
jgi:hypothetical protein